MVGRNRDLIRTMDTLFRDTPASVSGDISEERRASLENQLRSAAAYAKYSMEERGLYPVGPQTESMRVLPIEPDERGLEEGHTNGGRIVINSYRIPGTRYYRQLQKWIGKRDGAFGRYLKEKLGTPEKADESLGYAVYHEANHNETQLRPMRTKDGRVLKPFVERLFNGLKRYYVKRLKKNDKWISDFLAYLSFRPLAEGMNEVFTENAYNGRTAAEISRVRGKMPDTYSWYAKGSADFCARHKLDPGEEGAHFYGREDLLRDYVDEHPARIRIPKSYLKKAA
ncbi:MAG: hypothetical protein JXC85_05165 [Candidatus Aenigmarchaeota archaeon]|nr:hypothetical protein [Candidatus Aenigmarchaeota archaeon]